MHVDIPGHALLPLVEGDGPARTHVDLTVLPRVRAHTRGDVDRHNISTRCIDRLKELPGGRPHLTSDARAEHRVHDHIESREVGHRWDQGRGFFQQPLVHARLGCRRLAQGENGASREAAGDDVPVATVVPSSAHHRELAGLKVRVAGPDMVSGTGASPFHEHLATLAEPCRCELEAPHLTGGDSVPLFHRVP